MVILILTTNTNHMKSIHLSTYYHSGIGITVMTNKTDDSRSTFNIYFIQTFHAHRRLVITVNKA